MSSHTTLTPRSRMGSVNLVVIVESVRTLVTHNSDEDTNALHVPSLISVGAALGKRAMASAISASGSHRLPPGVKFLLFLYCSGYRNASSQVRMLWEDHRNDLFINGFGERRPSRVTAIHACVLRANRPPQACSCPQVGANSDGVSPPLPRARTPFAQLTAPADLDPMGAIIVRPRPHIAHPPTD